MRMMRRVQSGHDKRRPIPTIVCAFTLVEIVIIVFVIGVLMSIALPVMLRAKENSRSATCAANLAQLHHAYAQYAQDHDELIPPYQNSIEGIKYEHLPYVKSAPRTGLLKAALKPYTGGAEALWHCPSDTVTRSGGTQDHIQTSYFTSPSVSVAFAYGLVLDMSGAPPASFWIKAPPTAAALRDADSSRSYLIGEQLTDIAPEYTHNGAYNILYFDGHVKPVPWKEAPR